MKKTFGMSRWPLICVAMLIAGSVACRTADHTTAVPEEDADQLYWSLQLNHTAMTLSTQAPWDTVRLRGTPMTYNDVALSSEGATISYRSLDTNAVRVTDDGMVVAKTATSATRVIVRLTIGQITHVDTALVKVVTTPAPPPLQSFSIQPPPDDSAKIETEDNFDVLRISDFVDARDVNNQPMSGLLVDYRSKDPQIAKVDRNTGTVLAPRLMGDVQIVASGYAFGVAFADTLTVTIGRPLFADVTVNERPRLDATGMEEYIQRGGTREIGVGGFVLFSYFVNTTVPVPLEIQVLDTAGVLVDPYGFNFEPCTSLPVLSLLSSYHGGCGEYLLFTQPGTYRFQNEERGIFGTIIVVDERR